MQLISKLAVSPVPNYEKILKNDKSQLFNNANDSLQTVLILLSKRLKKIFELRFISIMNPYINKILNDYLNSYSEILKLIGSVEIENVKNFKINNLQDNEKFVKISEKILEIHSDNIIDLSNGIREVSHDINKVNEFLNIHLSERILLRLILNNHLNLSNKGINLLNTKLNVIETLNKSINFVNGMTLLKYYENINFKIETIIINKDQSIIKNSNITEKTLQFQDEIIFPYFQDHLEYVLNELIKNSSRALIESNKNDLPINILILINKLNNSLQFKFSDNGNGIHPKVIDKLWNYSFTTVKNNNENSTEDTVFDSSKDIQINASNDLGINNFKPNPNLNIIAGMGYGLPLSLTYCKLFNGGIKIQSIWGKGTDVYVNFKGI